MSQQETRTDIKQTLRQIDGNYCAFTGEKLPPDSTLTDLNKVLPTRISGPLQLDNVRLVDPVANMVYNQTYVERPKFLEDMKAIVQNRNQVIKAQVRISNQLTANKRATDYLRPDTVEWLKSMLEPIQQKKNVYDKLLEHHLMEHIDKLPVSKAALQVRGVGKVTVAYCAVYIRMDQARHPSSLWKYAGLHAASHKRYTKGETSGGNRNLRTALFAMMDSQQKGHGAYRPVYDEYKQRLANSEQLTETILPGGRIVQKPWKDVTTGHRHGAALRKMMKCFLADYWFVYKEIMGEETEPIYAEAKLGKEHKTISPRERGWVY